MAYPRKYVTIRPVQEKTTESWPRGAFSLLMQRAIDRVQRDVAAGKSLEEAIEAV